MKNYYINPLSIRLSIQYSRYICRTKHIEIPYITATHDVNNPRSGRVMQAIGMKYRYSYNELWQPKNKWVTFRMYPLNLDGQENRIYKKYWNKYPIHFVETIPK